MPRGKRVRSCCKTVVYNVVEYMERMDKKKGCQLPVLKRATGEFLMMSAWIEFYKRGLAAGTV